MKSETEQIEEAEESAYYECCEICGCHLPNGLHGICWDCEEDGDY